MLNEECFINILSLLKFVDKANNINAGGQEIDLDKAKSIIKSLKENEKFDSFISDRFLEEYVLMIYKYKGRIKEEMSFPDINTIETNSYYINMSVSEFRKTLSRITIGENHLDEDEVEECCKLYEDILNNKVIHNILSYYILRDYALFIYTNRYQIRMVIDNKLFELPIDKDGNYILDDDMFISRINRDGGKNSPLWICMNVSEDAPKQNDKILANDIVVKNLFKKNQRETSLIAEEIARQLGLPVAQYYPAIYVGNKFKEKESEEFVSQKIALTPNFLKPGEELITGDRIAKYDMDISTVPDKIREFFRKQGVDEKEIERLISDYRIVMAYNCLINHRDCHNGNWGYIKSEDGTFHISHIFDLEGSLDENIEEIREIYVGNIWSTGNNIDSDLLRELLKDETCRKRVAKFLELDIENVFSHVRLSKGISIPDDKKKRVKDVISKEQNIIRDVIKEIEREESR